MTPEQRGTLADLLVQWEDLYRQGQDTPVDVLCKDHPQLAETLARHIAALKRVAWLDKGLEDDDDDDTPEVRPDDPRPPKVLVGRYRLDELIATGGFAEVWRAYDLELQRTIAVKIPKRTVVGSAESFLAEARRVARLKHPLIVPIHDVGLEDGQCFFVSEYIEGGSLADRLIKGKLTAEQACRWISSIAEALDHAHKNGVIHRDIKPANVLLAPAAAGSEAILPSQDQAAAPAVGLTVKLGDFGLGKVHDEQADLADPLTQLTRSGTSIGTPAWMAPEQVDRSFGPVGPATDVHALGLLLHRLLTGRTVRDGGTDAETYRQVLLEEPVAADQLVRGVPRDLAAVATKCLAKQPPDRYASAGELAADLGGSTPPVAFASVPLRPGRAPGPCRRPRRAAPARRALRVPASGRRAVAAAAGPSRRPAGPAARRRVPRPG